MKFELKPFNRNVPDGELLDDLKKVAKELNKQALSKSDYDNSEINRFHSDTISRRFNGWYNAILLAGLEKKSLQIPIISDAEFLEDLKRVSKEIAPERISIDKYNEKGKFSSSTIKKRFGWNTALQRAGIDVNNTNQKINENDLLENLQEVWIKLGHQPSMGNMVKPHSNYTGGPYCSTYGSWRKALETFVEYINSGDEKNQEFDEISEDNAKPINSVVEQKIKKEDSVLIQQKEIVFKHATKRNPSERLKVQVLMRDGNQCRLCGITVTGENIHFDHIKPWSKGGETILDNLQVLCAKHNLAKGDLDSN